MQYKVQLEQFEGPLDLLLDLIEKEEMDINEVSMANVTDQYVKYIETAENIDPSNMADFLVVASKLILIKSKTLLPGLELEEEEEESIEELKMRLQEYKRFKDIAKKLKEMYNSKYSAYERRATSLSNKVFYPGDSVTIESLFLSARGLVGVLDEFKKLREETICDTVSIKDKISHIQEMLTEKMKFGFSEVIKKSKSKVDAIVSFLAMLELVKQKIISVTQDKCFEDIKIHKRNNEA